MRLHPEHVRTDETLCFDIITQVFSSSVYQGIRMKQNRTNKQKRTIRPLQLILDIK